MNRSVKTSVRHLWKRRLFTTLNIFGLAVSVSVCWIIYRLVDHEFSYDKNLPARDNIYRVITGHIFDDKESYNGGVCAPLYTGIRSEIPGIDFVVPVFGQWKTSAVVNNPGGAPLIVEDPTAIVATDSAYFKMLSYKWLAGNQQTALSAPEALVLTESRAKQYFPGFKPQEIINKTVTYYGFRDTVQKAVTGVVADYDPLSEFTAKEFFSLPVKAYALVEWTNTNGSDKVFLQFNETKKPEAVLAQVSALAGKKWADFEKEEKPSYKSNRWLQLLPLKDSHFSTFINEYNIRKASKSILLGLVGIGAFLLLLACINYVNMSVAQIPTRSKEIGVRKTLGGGKRQLISQFLTETFVTTLIAVLLAFVLGRLGFFVLRDILPPGISPVGNTLSLVLFILGITLGVTLFAGLYPAWLITKVKTANVFRGVTIWQKKAGGFSLQKALIVFQFMIALVFITGAIITGKQLQYSLSSDMGFNKDAVVLIDVPWKYTINQQYKNKQFTLQNEFLKDPVIKTVAMGTTPMSNNYSSSPYNYTGDGKERVERQMFKKWVDTSYIGLYELELLAGRNLKLSDTATEYVINETARKAFGFASPADAIGKMLAQGDRQLPIVGVVNDFHMQNFYTSIDPALLLNERENISTFNIKLDKNQPAKWAQTIKKMEDKWNAIYPAGSFKYTFYDDSIERMYAQERNLSRLINLTTAIAIFISCLGLFGLATLTAYQRTKEIGIRKVLGASAMGIVRLMSKEYVLLVLIAFVIATPIAWWTMSRWLQDFVYRINMQWWMFALAGLGAIAIALITVSYQAIKTACANPVKSLRSE
jgi:putative ABC transport system permease protein